MKRKSCTRIIIILVIIAIFLGNNQLHAQTATDAQAKERIDYIQMKMDDGKTGAGLWWFGWAGIYACLAGGQFAIYKKLDKEPEFLAFTAEEDKDVMLVGSVKSALGFVGMFIDPMVPFYAPGQLRNVPGNTAEERTKKLSEAERLFGKSAKRAVKGRGWLKHTLAFIVNAAGSAVLYYKYDVPASDSIVSFVTGMAVSEACIFTQPMRARDDWNEYRNKYGISSDSAENYDREWFIVPYFSGLGVGIYF